MESDHPQAHGEGTDQEKTDAAHPQPQGLTPLDAAVAEAATVARREPTDRGRTVVARPGARVRAAPPEPEQTVLVGAESTTVMPGGDLLAGALAATPAAASAWHARWIRMLAGDPAEQPLSARMVRGAAAALTLVGLGLATAALALGWDVEAAILGLVSAGWWAGLYWLVRRRTLGAGVELAAVLAVVVAVSVWTWLRFGGASGPAPLVLLGLTMIPLSAARGWGARVAVVGVVLGGATLILQIQLLWPDAIRGASPVPGADWVAVWVAALLLAAALLSVSSVTRENATRSVAEAEARTDRVLESVMPQSVVERLRRGERNIADRFDSVTVIFADLTGFTRASSSRRPGQVLAILNQLFTEFDVICERHGIERIKTIGDAYMAAAGVPDPRDDHAHAAARAAIEMMAFAELNRGLLLGGGLRIGLHTGKVVAGVVGSARLAYDLWGDAVNLASRMESQGVAGRIQVSWDTAELIGDDFVLRPRGEIDVRGRGKLRTYFLEAPTE